MEVLFFVLAVYGSIFLFAYFVTFLLPIIIWETIKALWIFKGSSKQQKIDLIPSFLFVGYTALAIGIGVLSDMPIGFVIAGWVIATIIMAISSSDFHDKPINKKEKVDLIFVSIFIGCTVSLIAIIIHSNDNTVINFGIISWLVIITSMGFWSYNKHKRIKNQDQDNP